MSENSTGIWRDGELLVVERQSVRFPDRCLWTNEPVNEPPTLLRVSYRPAIGFAFRVWNGLRYDYGPAQNAELRIPSDSAWRGNNDANFRRIGWIILSISLSMLAFSILAALFLTPVIGANVNSPWFTPLLAIIAVPGGLGAMGTLIGLGWPFVEAPTSRNAPLSVPFLDDRYVWLPGVHSGIVAAAPPWPNRPLAEQAPRPTTLGEAFRRDYPALILLVIIAAIAVIWQLWGAELLK